MSNTRETLVLTAINLFLGKGYGVVGTTEICREAQVNKGTFYYFFASKSDLLIAAIQHYMTDFEVAFEGIARSEAAPADKLRAIFRVPQKANQDWKASHGFAQGCLVGNMTLELSAVELTVRAATQDALLRWQRAIEPIVAEIGRSEHCRGIDATEGAQLVIGMIQGALVLAKTFNDPTYLERFGALALSALQGMARPTLD
jgi:TetR/AcrR family transcriptional regulator, transcriptional repressor for nem operon